MWLDILNQIFDICVVPLLGLATFSIVFAVRAKIKEATIASNNELVSKYLSILEDTVVSCVEATNQTYVDSLKGKDSFDVEAQKQALNNTLNSVMSVLSDDMKTLLNTVYGDLEALITEKIESTIWELKQN